MLHMELKLENGSQLTSQEQAKPSLESKIGKQRLQTKSGHVKGKRIKPFGFRKSLLAY